jgi:hypothetical protein
LLIALPALAVAGAPGDLRVGVAGHAFDHLGSFGEQAETAAASGANIIYVSGLGGLGYEGLASPEELAKQRKATTTYLRRAKDLGIRLAIGYVCATSIVKLDAFDKNWPPEFRARFHLPPSAWRQQDRKGNPLPSWYGGDYQPACMNNPDWRTYERFMVRQQLEAGCDGIFCDNPTVHPQGCYCQYCMDKFAQLLRREGLLLADGSVPVDSLRDLADKHPAAFMRFRGTIARDFLADMREYARTINHTALMTANNSLNCADALYSQCRTYGYNIYEFSQAEDFVVVEDMSSQPRTLPGGQVIEYGPTYKQLHAISHGKPVVAVTIAESDYHTPPNLVRLAMAEAAANDASYLSWPTWPEPERKRMCDLIRPQADFLRHNADLLNGTRARRDVVLFLPFRNWLLTGQCRASQLAAELARSNLQFEVICEDALRPEAALGVLSGKAPAGSARGIPKQLRGTKVLLAGSRADFVASETNLLAQYTRAGGSLITAEKADWLKDVQAAIPEPSIRVVAAPTVRAVVSDQPRRTLVHLLNLNVQRISTSEDKVTPVTDLRVAVRVPLKKVHSVRALTADAAGTSGAVPFTSTAKGRETLVQITLPRLNIATLVVIE